MRRYAGPDDATEDLRVQLIEAAPQALPPVATKHLLAAWELASDAARASSDGRARALAFRPLNRDCTELLLMDRDAACWFRGMEEALDLKTRYGMSVCLRLLALVDLLGREAWAARLALTDTEGIRLAPALLRAAAEAALTEDAQLDEQDLLSRLQTRAASGAEPGA